MDRIKEEFNISDAMDIDEFIIKEDPDDENNILQLPLQSSHVTSAPENFAGIESVQNYEPKTEPDFTENGSNFEVHPTVPLPIRIPKIEADMIDSYITQSASTSTGNEFISCEDETSQSVPGPSDVQNTRSITPGRGKRRKPDLNKAFKKLGYMATSKHCGVLGCGASCVRKGDGLTVFKLPNNIDRRTLWLKLIDRMDLLNKPSNAIHICEKHFQKSDIIFITTTKQKTLKNTAVPSLLLPYEQKEHKGVQAIHIMFDNCTQTDYSNMETKAVQVTSDAPGIFNNNELKKLISESKKRLKLIENGAHKTQIHAFNNWCDRFLPNQLAEIIKAQAVLKFNSTGNRYTLVSKSIGLKTFYTNKQAYELLSKDMCLPHSASLKRIDVPVSTEYNEDIMTSLKMKVDIMSEREKYCSVIVDLMKLKATLGYMIKKDRISGLHDVNGCQSLEPAQYALVIFARGLFVNWSQPIAFALLSRNKKQSQVSKWIDMYLTKLLDIGLKIKTFIPTIKSELFDEGLERSISIDKPFFFVNKVKIYYISDVPDLLKELRNHFVRYKFHFKKANGVGVADIKHVTELFNHDPNNKLRLAPKLTRKHLQPVTKQVRYAAQLFSRSVATALEMVIDFDKGDSDKELDRDTVDFLILINDLFDILNSSSIKGEQYKKAFCGEKSQVDLLQKSFEFFQTLQIFKRQKIQLKPRFIENFLITIKSVLLLFEDLKLEGHDHLFTRHLYLETSKKFFKAIKARVGMVVVPSTPQFLGLFRGLYLTHLLKPPNQRNCSSDLAKFLVELKEKEDKKDEESATNQKAALVESPQTILQSVSDSTTFFTELRISEENNIIDVCKILLKGCLKHHKNCTGLKTFVKAFQGAHGVGDNNDWAMHTSDTISPVYFVSFIDKMEKEFCEAFEALEENGNIGSAVYERVKDIEFAPPCPCFPTKYLKGLFIRLRIYIIVQYNTEVYRINNFDGEHVVIPRLTSMYA